MTSGLVRPEKPAWIGSCSRWFAARGDCRYKSGVLALLLAAALARADDSTAVLVASFQPTAAEAGGVASLLENLVAETLDDAVAVRVIRVEDTPSFADYGARIYMEGCPPGQVIGCSQVVGERGGAAYGVTGTVTPLADGAWRVGVSILDIDGARVMVAFQSDLAGGGDQAFADGVVKVLLAAIRGEIGTENDIRTGPEADAPRRPDNDELAAQIAELSTELGQVSQVISEPRGSITRPAYTVADLAAQSDVEGVKPWERVGMTPGEYLRFRNAGVSTEAWRARAVGRQGELHLRVQAGWWHGPVDSVFYSRYAYDPSLQVIDTWSSLQVDTGNGPSLGGEVAFGVLPWVDVGVGGGVGFGHIDVDVSSDQSVAPTARYQTQTPWFGPRVTLAPFPQWRARPLAGVGATVIRSPGAAEILAVPAEVLPVSARWLVYAEVFVGGEVEVSDHVALSLRVPVDLLVGGEPAQEERATTTAALDLQAPDASALLASGALLNVEVRLFGKRAEAGTLLDEEP